MRVENKEQLKKELILRGWYIFPNVDSSQLSVDEWEVVLKDLVEGTEWYVCYSVVENFDKYPKFILESLEGNGVVTNWFVDKTGNFLDEVSSNDDVNTLYRILWIEYILENYND